MNALIRVESLCDACREGVLKELGERYQREIAFTKIRRPAPTATVDAEVTVHDLHGAKNTYRIPGYLV